MGTAKTNEVDKNLNNNIVFAHLLKAGGGNNILLPTSPPLHTHKQDDFNLYLVS